MAEQSRQAAEARAEQALSEQERLSQLAVQHASTAERAGADLQRAQQSKQAAEELSDAQQAARGGPVEEDAAQAAAKSAEEAENAEKVAKLYKRRISGRGR